MYRLNPQSIESETYSRDLELLESLPERIRENILCSWEYAIIFGSFLPDYLEKIQLQLGISPGSTDCFLAQKEIQQTCASYFEAIFNSEHPPTLESRKHLLYCAYQTLSRDKISFLKTLPSIVNKINRFSGSMSDFYDIIRLTLFSDEVEKYLQYTYHSQEDEFLISGSQETRTSGFIKRELILRRRYREQYISIEFQLFSRCEYKLKTVDDIRYQKKKGLFSILNRYITISHLANTARFDTWLNKNFLNDTQQLEILGIPKRLLPVLIKYKEIHQESVDVFNTFYNSQATAKYVRSHKIKD